jgi:hypothetical protein
MSIFSERRSDSEERLALLQEDLATSIKAIDPSIGNPDVCIYATGSLARREANRNSDLDAFFFLTGSSDDCPLGRINDIKVLHAVLKAQVKGGFPDFSNEGEYLKFLHIEDILKHIGGREDDYHNALTARMLLMLESEFLYNKPLFEKFRSDVIERYFIDFHQHSAEFRPIFLLNDILRFWRTMCLNYEHNREWKSTDPEKCAKGRLANLKLRFSRLNICFGFISVLLSDAPSTTPEQVVEIARLTPLDRLQKLSNLGPAEAELVKILLGEYAWFLDAVSLEKTVVLEWISSQDNRSEAFARSKVFIDSMYKLVFMIAERHSYTRYLII